MTTFERLPIYNPPIPDDQREEYEKYLAGVIRWENGTLASSKVENDLQHTRGVMTNLEDVRDECPNIASEIDFSSAFPMGYIHDAGEIYSIDLAHTHPDYDNLKPRVKRREKAGFRLLARHIENEQIRNLAKELYKRVEQKLPVDKESQLVDFADKVQAVRFGLEHVYPGDRILDAKDRTTHLSRTINVLLKPGEALIYALESPRAKKEALDLIKKEVERFTMNGYSYEEMQPYIERVSSLLPNDNHNSIATHEEMR